MRRVIIVSLAASLLACTQARATEACPSSPCAGPDWEIDTAKCAGLAAWVATGTISDVTHHVTGDPLFKDFAEFTFTAKTSEKGGIGVGQKLKFQVGWCDNRQEPPEDTSGTFRFYGLPLPTGAALPNEYLYFERVSSGKE